MDVNQIVQRKLHQDNVLTITVVRIAYRIVEYWRKELGELYSLAYRKVPAQVGLVVVVQGR